MKNHRCYSDLLSTHGKCVDNELIQLADEYSLEKEVVIKASNCFTVYCLYKLVRQYIWTNCTITYASVGSELWKLINEVTSASTGVALVRMSFYLQIKQLIKDLITRLNDLLCYIMVRLTTTEDNFQQQKETHWKQQQQLVLFIAQLSS